MQVDIFQACHKIMGSKPELLTLSSFDLSDRRTQPELPIAGIAGHVCCKQVTRDVQPSVTFEDKYVNISLTGLFLPKTI